MNKPGEAFRVGWCTTRQDPTKRLLLLLLLNNDLSVLLLPVPLQSLLMRLFTVGIVHDGTKNCLGQNGRRWTPVRPLPPPPLHSSQTALRTFEAFGGQLQCTCCIICTTYKRGHKTTLSGFKRTTAVHKVLRRGHKFLVPHEVGHKT